MGMGTDHRAAMRLSRNTEGITCAKPGGNGSPKRVPRSLSVCESPRRRTRADAPVGSGCQEMASATRRSCRRSQCAGDLPSGTILRACGVVESPSHVAGSFSSPRRPADRRRREDGCDSRPWSAGVITMRGKAHAHTVVERMAEAAQSSAQSASVNCGGFTPRGAGFREIPT